MKDQQASYPQLRFKGFTDPWEERKLSSISERVTRKNKNNESTLPLTISAQDGLVDQNDFFNKQVASRDVTGYFLVKNGEFAYNKSYSNGYPWGAIKRLDKYDMGVLSTLYIVFRPTKINSQFLVSYYDTTRWYREVSKNAAEGARNHGLLNIAPTDFFNTLLVVPKIVDEQQKIGSFFKQLDDTIALHQRKLAKLKELKQGYLQKLFPRNGSKFPQLRFAGFADAWEQRKLGEIVEINSGRDYKKLGRGKIPVFGTGGYMLSVNGKLSDRDSVGIGRKGSIDKPQFLSAPFWTVDTLFFMTPKNKNDAKFIFDLSQLIQWKKYDESTGVPSLSKSTISNIPITVTKEDEQNKVSTLFELVDKIIAANQRKVEKLKELKKGYMQKMFC